MPIGIFVDKHYLEHRHFNQFIGLKDKTGNEIWEGDIVRSGTFSIPEIVFEYGSFRFKNTTPQSMPLGLRSDNLEVIGNIYKNPDLV